MRRIRLAMLLVAVPWVAACAPGPTVEVESGDAAVTAFVSILPQAWFVERIGGQHVAVEVLVGPGESPATYDPTLKQLARLGRADVFFRIGVPFETARMPRIRDQFPDLRVVDCNEGIDLAASEADEAAPVAHGNDHADDHDHGHDHDHGGGDPHTWMSPVLAKRQARTIAEALADLDPAHAEAYQANLEQVLADLDALHQDLQETLAPLAGRTLYVFHPAYGHFARTYGLEQVAVERGGKSPDLRSLGRLIQRAKADGVRVIFVQPQFESDAARTIAEAIGGAVVPMDPLARDYLANLRRMAEAVREGLAGGAEEGGGP